MDDERCADAKKFERIDAAFKEGDLDALRAALDDPGLVPNGHLHPAIGGCLVYAIDYSPLAFIRTLLEIGANPNAPVDDGFPPLIAALSAGQEFPDFPGVRRRTDVDAVLRLLLAFGADPNCRGLNDYTPLHMAVAVRNARAIRILLDGGADPALRTRIDECETPGEMAAAAGLRELAAMLAGGREPPARRLRSGLTILADVPGTGDVVRRQHRYVIQLRIWLTDGTPVRWKSAWGSIDVARLEDEGEVLVTAVRIDRRSLMQGLFYGVEGMRVGGMRRLAIAPHLAYGARGVPDIVPPGASLTAEITILEAHEVRGTGREDRSTAGSS